MTVRAVDADGMARAKKAAKIETATAGLRGQNYELVPVAALRSHPKNPRKGNVAAIVESIKANQFYGACLVQRSTGNILAGNHRWVAAKECGLAAIPVLWIDCDDAEALRILLVDNRTNDLAEYDEARLADVLKDIQMDAGMLDGTGFTLEAFDDLLKGLESEAAPGARTGALPEPAGDRYKEQYGVIIVCKTEADQKRVYGELQKSGYACRVVAT